MKNPRSNPHIMPEATFHSNPGSLIHRYKVLIWWHKQRKKTKLAIAFTPLIAVLSIAITLLTTTNAPIERTLLAIRAIESPGVQTSTKYPRKVQQSQTAEAASVPFKTNTKVPTYTSTAQSSTTSQKVRQPTPTGSRRITRPTSCININCNPWGYNFSPGRLIYYPTTNFCGYFSCISSFKERDDPGDGYIVECRDGRYSQSGGERGACSYHGGVLRSLYAH